MLTPFSRLVRRPSGVCLPGVVRRLVPVECERLMGFPRIVTGDVSAMTKDEYIVWLLATHRIENLQLLTPADNSTKAEEDGLYRKGNDNPSTKLTDKEVEWIFDDYWSGRGSIRELAERAGISKSRVQQIIHMEDWTQIPWRGKPADQCPDGPRYKALGNSMCTNVMAWIGERIDAVEKENANGRQEA